MGGCFFTAFVAHAEQIHAGGLSFQLDSQTGNYSLQSQTPAMNFEGSLGRAASAVAQSDGRDSIGAYLQISFQWRQNDTALKGGVRLYSEKTIVVFTLAFPDGAKNPQIVYPDFRSVPQLHILTYADGGFAPPLFKAGESGAPWVLFDDQYHTAILSPASHFLNIKMRGDGVRQVAVGLDPLLPAVPAGFEFSSLMTLTSGINAGWALWGRALTDLTGKIRPSNEADTGLRCLGYWTDNGAKYFYNYDTKLGYATTLVAEIRHLREQNIPVRYLQLDSWWYPKYKPAAKAGEIEKNDNPLGAPTVKPAKEKAAPDAWEKASGGGIAEYKANPAYFPDGLKGFQEQVDLPLITHARWISSHSPYHEKYRIEGVAPVDSRFWEDIASYLQDGGVMTFEQDWLSVISEHSQFPRNPDRAEAFFDSMSQVMAKHGLTVQYCMATASQLMQGAKYSNVITSRVSNDCFIRARWREFVFTSPFAHALGIWPWTDVSLSTTPDAMLLQTLSAGMVGFGDLPGRESAATIMPAVRADGVIVKPDEPLVPIDQSYVDQAHEAKVPIIAATYTDHGGVRTGYVFAFTAAPHVKSKIGHQGASHYFEPISEADVTAGYSDDVGFVPSSLGFHGSVYVYDYFTRQAVKVPANGKFSGRLGAEHASFYVCAAPGPGDIAFLGDLAQYVGTGKARIPELTNSADSLTASVAFARGETSITLHGFADSQPAVKAVGGSTAPMNYDPSRGFFSVAVTPAADAAITQLNGEPVRIMKVIFSKAR